MKRFRGSTDSATESWPIAPHLRHFARVRHAMANAGALSASLTALLENGRSGFVQLNGRGRILEANDRAREILLERDGLCDAGGARAAGLPGENAELQRLAGALPPYGERGVAGSMKITRTKTRTPLVLDICPCGQRAPCSCCSSIRRPDLGSIRPGP